MFRLLSLGVLAAVVTILAPPSGSAGSASGKKLLLITESRGFRHGVVTRKVTLTADVDAQTPPKVEGLEIKPDKKGTPQGSYGGRVGPEGVELKAGDKVLATVEPCLVEKTFMEMAKKHGFQVVCSQDARAEINDENLKNFDAVWFYTTGELPLSDVQKSDLLGFVRSGKGFGGSHSATDTFYKWPEYGEMIGAYFQRHPPGLQKIKVVVEDSKHPATRHLAEGFDYEDEIYHFKEPYSRDKLRVLMRVDVLAGPNLWRTDGDNALAWCREYGKGRVFYTAFGHADQVWRDERYQRHVLGGLRYLFFLEDADAPPSGAGSAPK
jgi:type 1 glutamine amidotransferase